MHADPVSARPDRFFRDSLSFIQFYDLRKVHILKFVRARHPIASLIEIVYEGTTCQQPRASKMFY